MGSIQDLNGVCTNVSRLLGEARAHSRGCGRHSSQPSPVTEERRGRQQGWQLTVYRWISRASFIHSCKEWGTALQVDTLLLTGAALPCDGPGLVQDRCSPTAAEALSAGFRGPSHLPPRVSPRLAPDSLVPKQCLKARVI